MHYLLLYSKLLIVTCLAYRPVIIIHGVWDLRFSLNFLAEHIKQVSKFTLEYCCYLVNLEEAGNVPELFEVVDP